MKHHNLHLFGVSFTPYLCTYQSVDQHEMDIVRISGTCESTEESK